MTRYLLLLSVLLLTACQSSRLVELDYQLGYDFRTLQSWQWAEPAVQFMPNSPALSSGLDAARLRTAISQQLTQQGFVHSNQAQLQVRAWLITEQQQQRTQTIQNDYWGPIWGAGLRTEIYDTTYTTQTLQIDMLDASNQQLIWRGSDSWIVPEQRTNPELRTNQLRERVQHVLHYFPPQ